MSDVSETGYHEIRLELKQILLIFLIAAGISIVLFLLGVMVGRNSMAEAGAGTGAAPVEKVSAETPKPVGGEGGPSFFDDKSKTGRTAEIPPTKTIEPPPSDASKPPEAPAPKKAGRVFSLQSGAFSTEENAKKRAMELEKAGYPITIMPPAAADKKKLYRVLVGEFESRDDALAAKTRLEQMGFKDLSIR